MGVILAGDDIAQTVYDAVKKLYDRLIQEGLLYIE